MPRFLKITGCAIAGVALIIAGFVYDVMFAGIPYQDPSPELQANWAFHSNVAFWIMSAGGILFSIGLLLIPLLARRR